MSPSTWPVPTSCRAPRTLSLVLVGSSLGGPAALTALFGALSANFHAPIVVVQHAPASVTRPLVRRLADATALDVAVVEDGMGLVGGRIHVAPGGVHVEVEDTCLRLSHAAPEHGCRPSVDVLFRSARDRSGVVAVVLTGMGSDGLSGARALRRSGARVLAQDAASSAVWGMAGQVVRAGLADAVGPPDELGGLLEGWSVRHRLTRHRFDREPSLGTTVNASATRAQTFDTPTGLPSGTAGQRSGPSSRPIALPAEKRRNFGT